MGKSPDIVIYVNNGDVTINSLTVQAGNSQAGGGIRVDNAYVYLNNLMIKDNDAFTGGGGLYVTKGAKVTIWRSSISTISRRVHSRVGDLESRRALGL